MSFYKNTNENMQVIMNAMNRGEERHTLRNYDDKQYLEVYKSGPDQYKMYSACYHEGRFRSHTHIISSKLCDLKRKLRHIFETKRFGGCGGFISQWIVKESS